ncbi:hypothetical protein V1264_000086 [Littorina saxatilis]|uniref:Sodium-coupled monocarboxylate transporter 1 n=2 Tax=Littorina saxatilis TaxID=31220 RepID=A0AAN9BYJ3_9CAEN
MVMDVLGEYPGLPGLFVACIFSASLSTVSSGVNALALVYLEDGVKPFYTMVKHRELPEHQAVVITKILAMVFGMVTIGLAYLAGLMDQTLVNITIKSQGMTGGPLLGLFILGMFFPCANSWGAGVGLLCGLSFSFWLGVGTLIDGPKGSILPLWPLNCSATMTSLSTASQMLTNVTSAVLATTAKTATTTSSFLSSTFLSSSTDAPPPSPEYDGLGLYELSYLWYGTASALVVIFIGLFVSFLTGCGDDRVLSPDHIIQVWPTLKRGIINKKKRYDVWKSQKKHDDKKLTKDYMMHHEEG